MVCKSPHKYHPCHNAMQSSPDPITRKTDYRPDIDGLRAIAVMSVLCYHAFPSMLHGGFVGVDIFFVISGFLISKHIWEELAQECFSIKTFYARRVRRIFPALAVVLLASLGMGWLILSPGEYELVGKHVTGGAGFVSNLIYWKEAGYFDSAADTKPLLHLWSLGIEEQFYIAWPLILAFLWRQPHHASWVMPSVLGASFAYSLFVVQQNVVADFYSPLTRFWELAIGAVLAHKVFQHHHLSDIKREYLAWLGLALISGRRSHPEESLPLSRSMGIVARTGCRLPDPGRCKYLAEPAGTFAQMAGVDWIDQLSALPVALAAAVFRAHHGILDSICIYPLHLARCQFLAGLADLSPGGASRQNQTALRKTHPGFVHLHVVAGRLG